MKKSHFKSILGLAFISFLLTALIPTETFAQRNSRKVKKVKVVTPVKHYKKQPRRGAQVRVLPKKARVIRHRNSNYHYREGVFYRPVGGSYVVTAPPIGIRISVLPPHPYHVNLSGRNYYYYYGTYYEPVTSGGYVVIPPPVGARIDALPDGYEVFELDTMVYYRLDETFYKAVLEPNGNVVYEVVRV